MPLSEHIPDSKTRGAFYIYLPIAAVIVNMFYIGNPVVGMVAGSFFLALAGHLLYRRFLMDGFGSISTTGVVLGSLMFLFFLSAVSSVFVIFYNFPPQAIAALLIASGIPLSFLGVKYWSSWRFPLSAREWLTKISVMDLKSAVLFSTALAVLIADIALLLPYKMELPAKVWSLIPMEHIYLVIALTLLTSIAIVGKFNVKVKFAVVLIHGFVLQAYVPLVVSTQFGGDTWYMMGEVIHALDPKSNYLVDRFSDPAFPTIRILGMNFPESLLTGWARGVANSLAVFFVEIFQLKIYESWVWIGPLVWLFSSKIILYRLGKKISSNEHFPLLLALGFSFFSTLLARGLFTAKITVSFPLFLLALLIWMWYIVDGNRKARNLALLFTAISFFGYSLFALVLISIGIAAILIRNRDGIFSFIPNTPIARYAVIGLLSVFMILLVPMADNAYGSRFKITSPNDTMFFFLEYTGFLGPVGGSFPINSWFTTLEWFAFSQVALWALFVYGVVRRNNIVPRQVHLALVWICAIVFLSFYIDINFMTAPHAVGNYLRSLVDLFRLPLVIIGIINVVDYIRAAKAKAEGKTFSSLKRDVLDMFASRALLVILFIILITSAHTIETGTLWLPQSDVLAAQYIAKTPEKYVVISNFENTFPVYAFTGGEIDGGGFPTTVILGTATDIPTLSYYRNIIAPGSSPEDILRHAASAAGTCSVYVLFPATYQNPDLFNKLSSIASSPRTFDADATSTLFKFGGIDRSGAPPRLGDLNVVVGRTDFDPVTRQLISEVVLQNNRCDIPLVVGLKWTVMDSYRVLGTVEEVIELKPFETKRVGSSFPVNNGANYQVAVEAFNLDNTAYASVPEGPRYIQIHVQDEQGNPVPATISGDLNGTTDSNGNLYVSTAGLLGGYTVTATASGYEPGKTKFVIHELASPIVVIDVKKSEGIVPHSIFESLARPPLKYQIHVQDEKKNPVSATISGDLTGKTDNNGNLFISGIVGGYKITASAPAYEEGTLKFSTFDPGSTISVITLKSLPDIRYLDPLVNGRLMSTAFKVLQIHVQDEQGNPVPATISGDLNGTTDSNGNLYVSTAGLSGGYTVRASAPGFEPADMKFVIQDVDPVITLVLQDASQG